MGKLGRPTRDKSAWWVTGRKKDGKMALLGPFTSTEECEEILFSAFPNDTGEKFYVNSVDRSKVTQILKFKLFSESHDLDQSMKPISHIK
jgi:hypothetical protein